MSKILLELESYHEDGKFIENETGVELTEEEAKQAIANVKVTNPNIPILLT